MRSSPPFLYSFNRRGAPIVPLRLAYRLAMPFGDLTHALLRSKREKARRNYARILGRREDDPEVEKLSRECFRHFSKYVAEMIHAQGWDIESARQRLEIQGKEHFEEAGRLGQGILFASAHMGSPEVVGSIIASRGYRITSVARRFRPKWMWDWAVACRKEMGVTLLPESGAGMKLIRALKRGEMVALVVDVGVDDGGGVPVRFFDCPTVFPAGPARLARITGAPILFGLAVRDSKGSFRAYISPPILSDRSRDADEDACAITQRMVDIFEAFVRRYPEQWYVFRDMWGEDGDTSRKYEGPSSRMTEEG